MSATFTINEKTGYTYVHLPSTQASTFHADHIVLDAKAAVAEANSVIRDAHMRYLRAIALPEIGDDYTDEEELNGIPCSLNLMCKLDWTDLPKKRSGNLQREKQKKVVLRLSEKCTDERISR